MAAKHRAMEVIKRLHKGRIVGAEIGVFSGKMSRIFIDRGIELFMVDSWKAMPRYGVSQADQDENLAACRTMAMGCAHVLHMDSQKASCGFPDGYFDFVFLDADHSYKGVKRDIEAWYPKVKVGGLFGGHDYANGNEPCGDEVKRAVDECAASLGKSVELGKDHTWFYR